MLKLQKIKTTKTDVKIGSDKNFGLVFTLVFSVIGLWPIIYGELPRVWSIWIAISFFVISMVQAKLLHPINKLWFYFGNFLHRVMNPLELGLLFFMAITPTGLLMRLFGKRPLELEFDDTVNSYWIHRSPPGPDPETMKYQF